EKRLNGLLSLNNLLNERKQSCALKLENAYWVQENFNLLKTYTDIIKKYYQAEAYNVDFITKEKQSIDRINEWTEEKTAGKIRELLNYGDVDSSTRLIITNAVYFKGFWQTQFDKQLTTPDNFYVNKNRSIKVQMMQQHNKEFPYYEDENFQVVKIPYECKNLSMLILLPGKTDSEIPKIPDYETLKIYYKSLATQKLDLYLPKFRIEVTYDLVKPLRNLGLKSAFDPLAADFSGITGNKALFISKAIQKSFVEVNEEGTEAAAATGIIMKITAARPEVKKIFKADHPFIFFIIEENTGLIVFAGKVVQP
ncbi:MAG: serpin family protein, partial [Candidatus Ratteibacteria bacterium]